MMRKTKFLSIALVLIGGSILAAVMLSGCPNFYREVADPNSTTNQTIGAIGDAAPVVGSGATATGTGWGAAVGWMAAVVTSVVGVYNNYRKKVRIKGKDSQLFNTTETTKAVVKAIEEVSDVKTSDGYTVGDEVREAVKEKLKDKDFYLIGRAIIDGLKNPT